MFMSLFQNTTFTPNITLQAHELQTVLALVAGGMGVTLTPSPMNVVDGIVTREVEDIDLAIQASMAWRKDNRSEILERFLAFFFDISKQILVDPWCLSHLRFRHHVDDVPSTLAEPATSHTILVRSSAYHNNSLA